MPASDSTGAVATLRRRSSSIARLAANPIAVGRPCQICPRSRQRSRLRRLNGINSGMAHKGNMRKEAS